MPFLFFNNSNQIQKGKYDYIYCEQKYVDEEFLWKFLFNIICQIRDSNIIFQVSFKQHKKHIYQTSSKSNKYKLEQI